MPLHEAVRHGKLETVEILLKHGADVNARTKGTSGAGASGGSVLNWALKYLEEDNPIVKLLQERGAKNVPPGAKTEL
jgi:ankyrin repeat protein